MIKKRTAIIAVIFFLVQVILLTGMAPAETLPPNPLTEINTGGANIPFKDTCNFLCMALSLYRSDAFNGLPKEELTRIYSPMLSDSGVRFDFAHMDLMKKGWTRYYPFSVGEKSFVARIFLTKEALFQPKLQVVSELAIENFGVTIQILPGIDEILNDCKVKPNKAYNSFLSDSSA